RELGVDPAPELRALHQAILRQDPALPVRRTGPLPRTVQEASSMLSSHTVAGVWPGPVSREVGDGSSGAVQDVVSDAASGPVFPGNVPAPVGGLVGREGDVAEVRGLLGERRLVTVAGPGG